MHIEFIKQYQNVPVGQKMHVPNALGNQWIKEGFAVNLKNENSTADIIDTDRDSKPSGGKKSSKSN
jgi:hypothetical protein